MARLHARHRDGEALRPEPSPPRAAPSSTPRLVALLATLLGACAESGPFAHHEFVAFPPELLHAANATDTGADAGAPPPTAQPADGSLEPAERAAAASPPSPTESAPDAPRSSSPPPAERIAPPDTDPFRLDALTDFVPDFDLDRDFEPPLTPYERLAVRDLVRSVDGEHALETSESTSRAVPWTDAAVIPSDCMVHRGRFQRDVVAGDLLVVPGAAPAMAVRLAPLAGPAPRLVRLPGDLLALAFDAPGTARFDLTLAWPPHYAAIPPWDLAEPPQQPFAHARSLAQRTRCDDALPPIPPPPAPSVPDVARRDALVVAQLVGLRGGESAEEIVVRLATHYGSFTSTALADHERTRNLFLDLARARKGVCRHRAHGFVVTAQALGVPSRLVFNQVHAFAEVWVDDLGWLRIDLGGGNAQVNLPPTGPPTSDGDATRPPTPEPEASAPAPPEDLQGDVAAPPSAPEPTPTRTPPEPPHPDPTAGDEPVSPERAQAPVDPRTVRIEPEPAPIAAAPGQAIASRGRLVAEAGTPESGAEIELWLRIGNEASWWLGSAATDADGRFEIVGEIPSDVPTGVDAELEWIFAGDGARRASRAR